MPNRLSTAIVLAACIACAAARAADPVPAGALLGLSAEQLQQAVPSVSRVDRPKRMTGGLVGSWAGAATPIAGVSFTPTFFLAEGVVRRIEYVATVDEPAAAFAAVRDWGRARWGAELASESPEGSYATWGGEDMNAYLQLTAPRPRAELRLVISRRVRKDASEL